MKDNRFVYTLLGLMLIGLVSMWVWDYQEDKKIVSLLTEQPTSVTKETPPEISVPQGKTHTQAIKKLDTEAGVLLSRVAKLIIRDEGKKNRPYLDTTGHVTIGVGRNLAGNGISVAELHALVDDIDYRKILLHTHVINGRIQIHSLELAHQIFTKPLTEHDITLLLTDDLNTVRIQAEQVFGDDWNNIDTIRKEVIIDVLFNLGLTHFKEFHKFIAAVKAAKWDEAAAELLLSKAARENIARYHRNATVMQTGDEKYFNL